MSVRDVVVLVCTEIFPEIIEKIKTLLLAMRKSGFFLDKEGRRRLARKTLFNYFAKKALVFLFCFFVAQKISNAFLSIGNISPLLALVISWYVDNKVVPDILRDIGFEL